MFEVDIFKLTYTFICSDINSNHNVPVICFFIVQSAVIRELEARVQQLGSEGENLTKIRNQLEREKIELEGRLDRLQADNMGLQEK